MTPANRAWFFWGGLLAVVLLLLVLLQSILLPFAAGLAIAYFLDPMLDRLQRRGLSRLGAAVVVSAVFLLLTVIALALLVPLITSELLILVEALPTLASVGLDKGLAYLRGLGHNLGIDLAAQLQEALAASSSSAVRTVSGLLTQMAQSGLALINLLSLLLITPLVSFFLMLSWDDIVHTVDSWLPRRHLTELRRLFREIDAALAGFVRGQATVCIIMAVYYATALTLAGLPFGLLVGLLAGGLTFIPFVGSALGLLLTVLLAVTQLSGLGAILLPIGLFLLGQAVEGNLLTPRLVGKKIGLHDVWVIFAVLAGGTLFGFFGVLVAVPAAAAIAVLIRFAHDRYLRSDFYLGAGGGP